ncbi:porin [Thalassospira alkalitolerans]|uniref:porin n=1 Tax=Thalassospira alkalitolerans TaxID=1293890 RepID=UPI0030EC38B6|tara:strand:- start:22245 stop:23291 length:1047 start_codon:yes stop_codon:yes gene_type:complete
MKKILVASSALVAVAFAGQASASEKISLSVGGYMEQWAGAVSEDKHASGGAKNAFQSDTEIHFKGSTTLDNGIEVGASIELEGETSGDQIDEQYLYVNGGFGQIKLGEEDGAAGDMSITAPSVGPAGVNDGDAPNYANMGDTVADNVWDDGDAKKLTYYTPSLGGFRAGVSYTADSTSESNDTATGGDDVVSAGVEFKHDFDGVSLAVAATGESKGEGEWYHVGGTVGFGNFTVGTSYGLKEAEFGFGENAITTEDDDMGWDVGVTYAMDAATVSLSYMYSEVGLDSTTAATTGVNEINTVDVGLAYTLGAGVEWKSSVFWFDIDGAAANGTADNDGFGAITGIKLSF